MTVLEAGADIVVLRHPGSVAALREALDELTGAQEPDAVALTGLRSTSSCPRPTARSAAIPPAWPSP